MKSRRRSARDAVGRATLLPASRAIHAEGADQSAMGERIRLATAGRTLTALAIAMVDDRGSTMTTALAEAASISSPV
jgi:hypothetical protein